MIKSNKIIAQIRFTNPIDELLMIQSGLNESVLIDGGFELEGILNYELNKRVNFFLLEKNKLKTLKDFLEYVGLEYILVEREVKQIYDSCKIVYSDKKFKQALEDDILQTYTTDDILDKINERGINSLTPLDKYILRK